MIVAGMGLLSKRRFGYVLSAYTLTVWTILSVIALFASPLSQAAVAVVNIVVFGGALHHFLEKKHVFVQDMPEIIHVISFLMFLAGWLGLSFAVNHIIYTTTLHTALVLGGSLLMMEGAVGIASKSRIGLWFSVAVLVSVVILESTFMMLDGGTQYLYRITLSTVGVYYLYAHRQIFN